MIVGPFTDEENHWLKLWKLNCNSSKRPRAAVYGVMGTADQVPVFFAVLYILYMLTMIIIIIDNMYNI